ncbi:MAG: nucleotidyl transferase AbiEii/AbiGii toxin family protein [Anaerolineae bacterium]
MISKADLVLIQKRHYRGLSLGALEKDYILTCVLRAIFADSKLRHVLVLKGGTALHKLFLGQRLSLDLDFTAHRPVTLEELEPVVSLDEIHSLVKDHRLFPDALTIQRLGYVGPLNHPNSIKVDVSFREPVLLPVVTKPYASPYFDPFPVATMSLEEMLAEKLRAASMRPAPRHFYDLWAILTQTDVDVSVLPDLVPRKLQTVGLEYNGQAVLANLDMAGALWVHDLDQLLSPLPDFAQVAGDLRQRLAALPL